MTEAATNAKKPRHIIRKILVALIVLIVVVILGFNAYIRIAYGSFYSAAKAEFPVPDTNSGFVIQDLDHVDKADIWLFSGYMSNSDTAPIIKRADNAISKIYVKLMDGTLYGVHHGSGITSTDEYTFLTTDSGFVVMQTDDLVNAKDGDTVEVIAERELGLGPAFLSISNGVLYTGEFYYPEAYETPDEHRLVAPDGTNNPSIMFAFDADPDGFYGFSDLPNRIYSIPEKVQGVCVTEDNRMVLSTSWGIGASHLLVYDLEKMVPEGTFLLKGETVGKIGGAQEESIEEDAQGADSQDSGALTSKRSDVLTMTDENIPLYFLDSSSFLEDIVAPPMSEGITIFDGRVYIPNESASNKYIFGKLLWGADMIYSLALS